MEDLLASTDVRFTAVPGLRCPDEAPMRKRLRAVSKWELAKPSQQLPGQGILVSVEQAGRRFAAHQQGLSEFWSALVQGLTMEGPQSRRQAANRRRRKHRVISLCCVSKSATKAQPSLQQLLLHPLAVLGFIPRDVSLFLGGAIAGAAAKTATAPFDRVKLMLQVQSVQIARDTGKAAATNLVDAFRLIFKNEGVIGFWKGNLPQVVRIIPYSAVQLFSYDAYKRLFQGQDKDLSVPARLAAGACAGMTSTLVTFPLDTLRLRLAVDPNMKSMSHAVMTMMAEEGVGAFYRGLVPSLLGIAPYIALNFCTFDLLKKSIPEEHRKKPIASFSTALAAATLATLVCYPLDTVRRQLQMKGSPFTTVAEALPGIVKRDGFGGLYRGFAANALKNLPSSSVRLTIFDAFKAIMAKGQKQFDTLVEERPALPAQGKEVAC